MRVADRDEVRASSGDALLDAVQRSVHASSMCWAVEMHGELLCIFGCAPIGSLLSCEGAPWMLGTDALDRHPVTLMKSCPRYIDLMKESFPHLRNYVDARNKKSIRWLRRLGFTIHPPIPYGVSQLPFHPFELRC